MAVEVLTADGFEKIEAVCFKGMASGMLTMLQWMTPWRTQIQLSVIERKRERRKRREWRRRRSDTSPGRCPIR